MYRCCEWSMVLVLADRRDVEGSMLTERVCETDGTVSEI